MTHTATIHPPATPGHARARARRRAPAVLALAVTAGVALAGCSGAGETGPSASPTTQVTTSSSSTPTSTRPASETAAPVSAPTSTAAPAAPAAPTPPPAPLPANVVGTGGPCHLLGELAQADDGSPLFCTEDPGGAGPLWLPQPGAGPDGTGPAMLGRPCMQEGVAVTLSDGAVLTCRLIGGGDVPGGLYWNR